MNREQRSVGGSGWRSLASGVWILLLLGLGGCAPFIPSLKHEAELDWCNRYGEEIANQNRDKSVLDPKTDFRPYACINSARQELVDIENRAGYFNRVVSYTAVAGGTYAGYEATRTHQNHSLLKHAAIGVAALAGISQVVGADQQIASVDAGIDALDCVRRAADAIDSEDPAEVRTRAGGVQTRFSSMTVYPGFTTAESSALANTVHVRTTDYALRADDFAKSVEQAKKTSDSKVYWAVTQIREKVRQQLATKGINVKDVYKAQQDSVNSMLGDLVSKSKQQQQAGQHLEELTSSPAEPAPGKAAQDAFAACVAPPPASS